MTSRTGRIVQLHAPVSPRVTHRLILTLELIDYNSSWALVLCLARPLRAVHSALCTRVFLNLRKAAAQECPSNPEFTMLTTLAFDHDHPVEPDTYFALEELSTPADDGEGAVADGDGEGEQSRLLTFRLAEYSLLQETAARARVIVPDWNTDGS